MKVKKILWRSIPFLLSGAILLGVLFYPSKEAESTSEKRIVRVWNIDTFEGGKGSRYTFIKRAALDTEKEREGVYYLVTSFSPEGAKEAFREGNFPDALSFGVGFSAYAERSLALPISFSGGEAGGKCYAYPWCQGGYFLFSLKEDFEEAGKTAISVGGSNLPQIAAYFANISGEELPSLTAYTKFLSGEYRYLLGTQRDVCRFASRGVTIYKKTLTEYNDLYQYFSILSEQKKEDCFALLETLLSAESRERLAGIGMESVDTSETKYTFNVLSSDDALEEARQAARDRKNPEKFLKIIEKHA